MQKAFDTVNHPILLQKLNYYGIRGLSLEWLSSYLLNRQHCVKIGPVLSSYKTINIGIPRSSIVGPLLFLFYVNDLPNVSSKLSTVLIADDTTLSAKHCNYEALITETTIELDKTTHWTIINRLSVNVNKTLAILFTNRHQAVDENLKVYFNISALNFSVSGKFLGVFVDRGMKFAVHIADVCSKVSKCVGLLYKIQSILPEHILLKLYYSLVYPYLIYCNIIWDGTFPSHIDPLYLLQKKLVRIITNETYLAHSSPLFHETAILKLKDIHLYLLAIHAFRLQSSNVFSRRAHERFTRNRDNLVPSYQRLSLTQHAVSYAAPKVWNELPPSLKDCPTKASFKKTLKRHIIDSYIDTCSCQTYFIYCAFFFLLF